MSDWQKWRKRAQAKEHCNTKCKEARHNQNAFFYCPSLYVSNKFPDMKVVHCNLSVNSFTCVQGAWIALVTESEETKPK